MISAQIMTVPPSPRLTPKKSWQGWGSWEVDLLLDTVGKKYIKITPPSTQSFLSDMLFPGFKLDVLNPSGSACNSYATCYDNLYSFDGTPAHINASWDPSFAFTFNVLSGSFCLKLNSNLNFIGETCNANKRPLCKFDCFASKAINLLCRNKFT